MLCDLFVFAAYDRDWKAEHGLGAVPAELARCVSVAELVVALALRTHRAGRKREL